MNLNLNYFSNVPKLHIKLHKLQQKI